MLLSIETKRQQILSRAFQKQKKLRKIQTILIGFVCGALIIGFLWFYLKEERSALISVKTMSGKQFSAEEIDFEKKQLVNPRFEGEDEKERPYVLKARLATQKGEGEVDLVDPKGQITLINGDIVTLVSEKGNLTKDHGHLFLEGNVVLNGQGCETSTEQAEADFKSNKAHGNMPVTSVCQEGTITGVGFSVDQGEGTIRYMGRPHMILHSKNKDVQKRKAL